MTNILVEGGARVLGSFLDAGQIDELHVFIATKLLGGESALGPMAGAGMPSLEHALTLEDVHVEWLDGDLYIRARSSSRA